MIEYFVSPERTREVARHRRDHTAGVVHRPVCHPIGCAYGTRYSRPLALLQSATTDLEYQFPGEFMGVAIVPT